MTQASGSRARELLSRAAGAPRVTPRQRCDTVPIARLLLRSAPLHHLAPERLPHPRHSRQAAVPVRACHSPYALFGVDEQTLLKFPRDTAVVRHLRLAQRCGVSAPRTDTLSSDGGDVAPPEDRNDGHRSRCR